MSDDAEAPAAAPVSASGEFTLTLEGAEHVLRPSHKAIDEFETETRLSLAELAARADARTLKLREVAIIVAACMRAAGRDGSAPAAYAQVKPEAVAALIYAETGGVMVVTMQLRTLLWLAQTGGYTAEGFRKPQPATSQTNAPG